MNQRHDQRWHRLVRASTGYGIALAATALAALARWTLPEALSPAPYLGFYPAVVAAAMLGGVGPGLVATFASLLLVNFVFGHFNIHDHGAVARQVIWIIASIGVSLLARRLRAMRHRAEQEAAAARAAEEAARESRERLNLALVSSKMAAFDWDVVNDKRTWSDGVHGLLGTNAQTFTGTAEEFFQALHPEDRGTVRAALALAVETTGVYETEYRAVWPDGSIHHIASRGKIHHDHAGRAVLLNGLCWDITARKQSEANQVLLTNILRSLNNGGDLHSLIRETLGLIRDTTGFDAVALRLRQGEDFPYFEQFGFSEQFLRAECCLCAKGGNGAILRDAEGRAVLECTCGLVISGRTDSRMSCFTEGGSFWTNLSNELLAPRPDADPRTNPRNRCIHDGYQSVGLFPVRVGQEIIGLLQLNDPRPGRFTPELTSFYQSVAQNLGLAIQRTMAEAALRQSEERYRALFDTLIEGFCIIEMVFDAQDRPVDHRFLEINPAFEKQTGLRNVQGRLMRDLAPDHEPHWFEVYGKVALTGEPVRFVNEAKALNRWYDVSAYRVGGSDSRKVAILFNDITERMRAEEELRRLNRTLRALGNSNRALIHAQSERVLLEEVCRIIVHDCSHAMVWIGYAEEDEARTVRPVASAGFEQDYLETLRITWADTERGRGPTGRAIRTGQPSQCTEMLTDPQFAPWRAEALKRGYASSLVLPLLGDGKAFGAVSIYSRFAAGFSEQEVKLLTELTGELAHGITTLRLRESRQHAQEALRQSEERLRTMADAMPQLAWIARPDGHIFWYNQRWYDYTGTTPAEMEGWGWQSVHDRTELPKVLERWKASLATGQPFEMTFPLRGADGSFRPFLTRGIPLKDPAGRVAQWFGTNTDVFELKRAEEALQQAQAQLQSHADDLEKIVASRTAKLQETVAELEHFSYAIVHDMRAPLRAMQGFAGMIDEECQACPHTLPREYFRRIKVASSRMDQLITDSLSYSKAARQELNLEPVNLFQLLDGLVETYPNLHPDKAGIWIDPNLPAVLGNEAALTQCFSNLLGNAVKFTKAGEKPQIRVWAEEVRSAELGVRNGEETAASTDSLEGVDSALRTPHSAIVKVWVEDNGIGIPQTALETIFGIFQRASAEYEGTGIGLAIVRKVVERMGGKVGVESSAGQGSRFWVELGQAPKAVSAPRSSRKRPTTR